MHTSTTLGWTKRRASTSRGAAQTYDVLGSLGASSLRVKVSKLLLLQYSIQHVMSLSQELKHIDNRHTCLYVCFWSHQRNKSLNVLHIAPHVCLAVHRHSSTPNTPSSIDTFGQYLWLVSTNHETLHAWWIPQTPTVKGDSLWKKPVNQ